MLSIWKKDYNLLKFKLGRIPMMVDFTEHGSRDPYQTTKFMGYNFIVKSWYEFYSNIYWTSLNPLELFSKELIIQKKGWGKLNNQVNWLQNSLLLI
jgi:hypothetical protein